MVLFKGSLTVLVKSLHGFSALVGRFLAVTVALVPAEIHFQSVFLRVLAVWVALEYVMLFQFVRTILLAITAQVAYFFCLNY